MFTLTADQSENSPIKTLKLEGRFDAQEVSRVKEWFNTAMTDETYHFVVDLEKITFMDSSALAVLVQGLKRCRQNEGDVHLCNLQPQVRIIFELTRLDLAFNIFDDSEEAVAAFAPVKGHQ